MYKGNFIGIFILVFLLGLFFQYNRMDGFLYLSAVRSKDTRAEWRLENSQQDKASLGRDTFLVIYNPENVRSTLLQHQIKKMLAGQKKQAVVLPYDEDTEIRREDYAGVVLATGQLQQVAALPRVEQYVEAGGTALFLQRLFPNEVPAELLERLGITAMDGLREVPGIEVQTDFLFGAKGFSMNTPGYRTDACAVQLQPAATVHIASADGMPLVWENPSGAGKYLVYNGLGIVEKRNIGLLTAALSQAKEEYIYPVAGLKFFFFDDFPAPEPEGDFSRIYNELQLSTEEFYRQVWWPTMLENARKYKLKYTGLIIESYGDQVKGPFRELEGRKAKDNLIVYGRELLKAGGELGIHGYNHQSLAPAGYNQEELDYQPWESQADMEDSLRELRRYIKAVYPDYDFQVYVPPSNILSPEGKAAVKNVFPEMKVYASLFSGALEERAYFQNFERHDTGFYQGVYEIPRVSAGHIPTKDMLWEDINVLNYIGVFSHFIHPDEIFYEESKNLSWAMMKAGLTNTFDWLQERYGWLQACTASEGADYLGDYYDMDYRVQEAADGLTLYCWNYHAPLKFVLRTTKGIDHTEGCQVDSIGEAVYLVTIRQPQAHIFWKGAAPL